MSALETLTALAVANTIGIAGNTLAVRRLVARRRRPTLLRGVRAIASRLGMSTRQVGALFQAGELPTFRRPGDAAPHATAAALDDWRQLWADVSAISTEEKP